MTKTDLARKYRDEHGMKMPTLKLARIMYNDNKLLFNNIEHARTFLRAIEGKISNSADNKGIMVTHKTENRPYNPYALPASDETIYEPFILRGHKRIALFADIHAPYHSTAALTAALSFCKKEKPDALLLDGDVIDCFQLSRFVKDPKKRHFAEELKSFQSLIQSFDKTLGCKIYFKFGNHEERYEAFLFQKAKELVGVEEFELDNIIKARANGITIVKDKRIIHAGGLNIIHGHEFSTGFFSPVNVARGLFLRGKTSAIQGHSHQTSEHTESDMNGKITTTWSVGSLCELHPAYAPLNKWNNGFAIIDLDGKNFDVRNKRIFKGEVL